MYVELPWESNIIGELNVDRNTAALTQCQFVKQREKIALIDM